MGGSPHYLSQSAAGWGVSATVTYTTGPEVTVNITYNSGGWSWRIRGSNSNPDRSDRVIGNGIGEYYFNAIDGESLAFQVYVDGSYSDGDIFVIDFDKDDGGNSGGGTSGGGSTSGSYHIYIEQGKGTNLSVVKTWDNAIQNWGGTMYDGSTIVWNDVFEVSVTETEGYSNATWQSENFTRTSDGRYTMISPGDVRVTSSATLNSYKLSIIEDTGAKLNIIRVGSENSGASIGTSLSNGDTVWHHDKLMILCELNEGYDLSLFIDSASIASGDIYTVSGNTIIQSTTSVKSYTLTKNADTGTTITVNRISSPLQGDGIGNLDSGATIYYNDVLTITFSSSAEYKITQQLVNQSSFTSGNSHTVTGNVEIVTITELSGVVHIFDGSSFNNCTIHIFNGSTWDQYIAYVFDGSKWCICS